MPTWSVRNDAVRAEIHSMGGMMGPVVFNLPGRKQVQPFCVIDWEGKPEASLDEEGPKRVRERRSGSPNFANCHLSKANYIDRLSDVSHQAGTSLDRSVAPAGLRDFEFVGDAGTRRNVSSIGVELGSMQDDYAFRDECAQGGLINPEATPALLGTALLLKSIGR